MSVGLTCIMNHWCMLLRMRYHLLMRFPCSNLFDRGGFAEKAAKKAKKAKNASADNSPAQESSTHGSPTQTEHATKIVKKKPASAPEANKVLRDHNKMQWVKAQMKKGAMNKQFAEVFENADKMSKLKGTQLVNECVVRDIQGRWTVDCKQPIFQDWGLLF
jgi:hypothetical protein